MWVARDSNGILCMYFSEPTNKGKYFSTDDKDYIYLKPEMFPDITWENSPKQIKIIVNKNE